MHLRDYLPVREQSTSRRFRCGCKSVGPMRLGAVAVLVVLLARPAYPGTACAVEGLACDGVPTCKVSVRVCYPGGGSGMACVYG